MAVKVDWYYRRKGDASCARADAFLEARGITAREVVDARKVVLGKPQIAAMLRQTQKVIAAKGKTAVDYDLKRDPPVEKVLYEVLLGTTGTLRAPSLRIGRTLVVGFHEDRWKALFA
jgi:arsenate reductase-like glutaredoxin family protein